MAKTLDEAGVKRLIQEIKGANKNLNTPIPISTDNTTESMAQNVKNIADFVEKAKAAGIANVNGMAVTCIIDDEYSGVGYILDGDSICGIIIYDDVSNPYIFGISNGEYIKNEITLNDIEDQVTSSMLVKGARKPIILTPDTTEIDEETYLKLLSDNVDVVYKNGHEDAIYELVERDLSGDETFTLTFIGFFMGDTSTYFSVRRVDIEWGDAPHRVTITTRYKGQLDKFLEDTLGFLPKNKLTPILQEIDLTGTDADRKAKLDKFETDWKALTGASDLNGARFVGYYSGTSATAEDIIMSALLAWDSNEGSYHGLGVDDSGIKRFVALGVDGDISCSNIMAGSFQHLEAITVYTDNTPEHMQMNLDNIAAYEANLQALGVDTTKSPMIPCAFQNSSRGWITKSFTASGEGGHLYTGIARDENGAPYTYFISINPTGRYSKFDAINSGYINNNFELGVVGVQANAKSLEAIIIKTGNTTAEKADNKAAINAYINNLKALGVDTTKGYNIPIYVEGQGSGFIGKRGDSITAYMGIMVSSGIPTFGIYVDAAGGYYAYKLQTETDNSLTTTSKKIVSAINEVNALAKGVNAFGAIELKASDNDSNKAAITAYLKILTDAGVSTTNGYSVPVRITGNSQEYHGMLNIGTGVLLSGVVTDVNENHHYPFNVSTTDGVITFDEGNYFLEKASNEVTEMLDAIKYSYTSVPFTDTTLSNKAQLEVFLSKVPAATVLHCTYMEIWAGTLHKINGDWYGLLVKNTNDPADNINVKLSADGTIIKSNSAQ